MPIPPMRADWTASGGCTSGSTAHPRGATRRASGGAATMSTTRAELTRCSLFVVRDTGLLEENDLPSSASLHVPACVANHPAELFTIGNTLRPGTCRQHSSIAV